MTIAVALRAACPKCGNPVPINALVPSVSCPACQYHVQLLEGFWQEVLDTIKVEAIGDRGPGSHTAILESSATVTTVVAGPQCVECDAELAATGDPLTRAAAEIPCSCGALTPIRSVPEDFKPRVSNLFSHIIGEDAAQLTSGTSEPEAETVDPVLFPCPGCGASLPVDGSSRTVKCTYCTANAYLPDDLWRRLHPVKTVERWFVHVNLAALADYKAAARSNTWSMALGFLGLILVFPAAGTVILGDTLVERQGGAVATVIAIILFFLAYAIHKPLP